MEDKLGDLITALTELVEKLNDKPTGEVTSKARFNPDDMFAPTEEQVSAKENKELAKEIAKENAKNNKEKKTSRKILKDVMPVSVVNFDSKALKQLGEVVSNNITDKVTKDTEAPKDKAPSWLKSLKMIGYGAFALIIGPIIALFAFFEEIGKQKWFLSLKEFLKTKVGDKLAKLFKPITSFFDRVGIKLSNMWKRMKLAFKPVTDFFDNIGKKISKQWSKIKNIFKPVTDTLKNIGTKIKNIGNTIKSLLSPIFGGATKPGLFTRLMNIILKNPVIKGMTTFFGKLGGMLGKIFLPITIILGVFDVVTGFMDGYEKEGSIIDGIQGGITKVFDTLIAMPLDMLKSAVSWILGKFGFKEAEKTLDAFSFSTLISDMIGGLFKTYKDIFAKITKVITGIWDSFIGIFTSTGEADEKGMVEKALVFVNKIILLPLDLLKDTVSWLLGAFGFEDAEKSLDSWSFSGLFEDLIGAVFGFMEGAFEFVKSLFTEPREAFKKIGKWFDKLFADPVGTIKALLPTWMTDFGTWVWDTLISPIANIFTSTAENPAQAKSSFLKMLPDWMSGFGDWVFDSYILPISQYFDKLLNATSVKEIISALIPDWMKDFGNWIYGYTIGPVMEYFEAVSNDPEGMKEKFIKMLPKWMTGFGEWIVDSLILPISQYFDKLLNATSASEIFNALIPDWMTDFGGWLYGNTIGPLIKLFKDITRSPVEAKAAFKKLLPKWMSGFGDWVFDSYILPISQYFDKLLNATSASEILSALIPDWLRDFGGWVYSNTIGPIMKIFKDISSEPELAKTAFLGYLPKWMSGFGEWVFDEVISPIAKWFTDFADPSVGFTELLPDWMLDVGKWVYNTLIKPIGDMITSLLDIDLVGMLKSKAKDLLPKAGYDLLFGSEEEEAAGKAAESREAATKATASVAGLSDTAQKTIAKARANIEETVGGDNTADRTNDLIDSMKKAMVDGKGNESVTKKILKESGNYDALLKTSGMDEKEFLKKMTKGYEYGRIYDSVSDAGEDFIHKDGGMGDIAMQIANQEGEHKRWVSMVNEYAKVLKAEGLKIDNFQYPWATLADKDSITSDILAGYNLMYNALDVKTDDQRAFARALEKVGIHKAMRAAKPVQVEAPEMNDFIWRPGQKPMTFSKGDILIGSHEDNISPSTPGRADSSGKDMINRMDKMVELMTEHSGIHTKVLEVLTESGLIDKQGNTVVNNGGNSTTVNNSVAEPSIMDFRDRVVGRLSK